MSAWPDKVLTFWFDELSSADGWGGSDQLDTTIRERFEELWREQKQREADDFLTTPGEALAAVILFDQFPRNMFRGHADMYATDHLARKIADRAIEMEFDASLSEQQRAFLYMPFMHSEYLDDQQKSVLLFTRLGDDEQIKFANEHFEVIKKFGRFPHRNEVLGRAMRDGEAEAIEDGASW